MVAPFLGCAFGGLVYDLLLNDTENTPINTFRVSLPQLRRRKVGPGNVDMV